MTDDRATGHEAHAQLRAGLAAWRGRTVLLAGPPRSGTSTLLDELTARGATVLGDGLVHIDPASGRATGEDPEAEPVAVDLVAILRFDRGFDGRPWRSLAMPEVVHELIGRTVDASLQPDVTLDAGHAVGRAAEGISGPRGEAADAAERLAEHLDALGR